LELKRSLVVLDIESYPGSWSRSSVAIGWVAHGNLRVIHCTRYVTRAAVRALCDALHFALALHVFTSPLYAAFAFAGCVCDLHVDVGFCVCVCMSILHAAFASTCCNCISHLRVAFAPGAALLRSVWRAIAPRVMRWGVIFPVMYLLHCMTKQPRANST
jgi:hypothetical protein